MSRNMFITTALPYTNGNFHLGHIMEYIQADIWVRHNRMAGNHVNFVCADDTHGAPIMIAAENLGVSPHDYVKMISASRNPVLDNFNLKFDHWSSTDSQTNHNMVKNIYSKLKTSGFISSKIVTQFYDEEKSMFLPDRYVKGECPKCGAKDQYGDSCEKCGEVYSATDLINPYSTISGSTPILKDSEHYFFKLSDNRCSTFLKNWAKDRLQPEVLNKINEWLDNGLNDWDISRDSPYFGIPIPDTTDKYFYVWLDAPIGYLSALFDWFESDGPFLQYGETRSYNEYINSPNVEQYHFIGKDIMYFHTLFWPAILHSSELKTPDNIFVHGFVTMNGKKMSKSAGTGLDPQKYIDLGISTEFLRYYLSTKMSAKVEDIDFTPEDFISKVNSDLVGKFINVASRSSGFLHKKFDGVIGNTDSSILLASIRNKSTEIIELYDSREFAKVTKEIMKLVDDVNSYFDTNKPWELSKEESNNPDLLLVCSVCIEAFRILSIYLKPIIPDIVSKVEQFLNISTLSYADVHTRICGIKIEKYTHLLKRVESDVINEWIGK